MKKISYLMFACVLCGTLVFTACSGENQEKAEDTSEVKVTETESTEVESVETDAAEVSREDIEKKIIGSWIVADRNGQPALTNEKCVFTFASPNEAYVSASFNARPELGNPWEDLSEADVAISDNKVSITRKGGEEATMVDELTISNITDSETQGSLVVKLINDGEEAVITEESIRFIKVIDDFSEDIIGTWEGHCTSEGSVYDDGQDHRWEYKDDGTYVYYEKDGDNWVPGDDTTNEYFVDGNLLCTRWVENGEEYREWWEIIIDGDKMNWTALREGDDGKTFTATFEMNRVEKDAADLEKEADDLNEAGKKAAAEEDYEKALGYFQQAADKGNARGVYNIGVLYENGLGVEQSYEKAMEYYKQSTDMGYAPAQYSLGRLYYLGNGADQDYEEAIKYLRLSVEQGYPDAQCQLGYMYDYGLGVEQSYEKAMEYYQLAADQGNGTAINNIGNMYEQGHLVEQDYEKALEYYNAAIETGNPYGYWSMGLVYEKGHGVEQDYGKAAEYYQIAADMGVQDAIDALERMKEEGLITAE